MTPANYLTPDVIAHFSNIQVEEVAKDVVKVFGGFLAKRKTGLLKTSIGYKDGYIAEAEINYGGAGSVERAKLAKTIMERLAAQGIEPIETRYDFIGLNSLYANEVFDTQEVSETRLRIAARTEGLQLLMLSREKQCHFIPMGQQAAVAFAQISKR